MADPLSAGKWWECICTFKHQLLLRQPARLFLQSKSSFTQPYKQVQKSFQRLCYFKVIVSLRSYYVYVQCFLYPTVNHLSAHLARLQHTDTCGWESVSLPAPHKLSARQSLSQNTQYTHNPKAKRTNCPKFQKQ